MAVAVELFHAASIIVDDLADREDARRDKLPIFLEHGEELSVLASHALVALGYQRLSSGADASKITDLWTKSFVEACVGQSLDYRSVSAGSLLEQQEKSLQKTEAFFGFLGAALDLEHSQKKFESAFKAIGRIFQIGNDVIDLMGMDSSPRMVGASHYLSHPGR